MEKFHPDNHDNDPFFPRDSYLEKQTPEKAPLYPRPEDLGIGVSRLSDHHISKQSIDELRTYLTNPKTVEQIRDQFPAPQKKWSVEAWDAEIKRLRALYPDDHQEIPDQKPLFITFEGGEGSGKSTQSKLLVEYLKKCNVPVFWTREPGGTDLGREIREILLAPIGGPQSKRAELFLFLADRAEHVETVIRPKLEQGYVVVCDRFSASTIAYQAYANELELDAVMAMDHWAKRGAEPDLTFFLDVDPEVGVARARRAKPNRFEGMSLEYHEKVAEGFMEQFLEDFEAQREIWGRLDANLPISMLHLLIRDRAFQKCAEYGYLPQAPLVEK